MKTFIIAPQGGIYTKLPRDVENELAEMAYSISTPRTVRPCRVRAVKRVPRVRRELSPQREKLLATYAGQIELRPSL